MKTGKKTYEMILRLDREIEVAKPSRMPLEERLEVLPGILMSKDLEIYALSCKIEDLKPRIKNIEIQAFNRLRAETVDGVKEGVTKPKYTVEQAEYESKLHLAIQDDGYKNLKNQEKALHKEFETLKIERSFVENSMKMARTLAWLKVGEKITEAIG